MLIHFTGGCHPSRSWFCLQSSFGFCSYFSPYTRQEYCQMKRGINHQCWSGERRNSQCTLVWCRVLKEKIKDWHHAPRKDKMACSSNFRQKCRTRFTAQQSQKLEGRMVERGGEILPFLREQKRHGHTTYKCDTLRPCFFSRYVAKMALVIDQSMAQSSYRVTLMP